MTSVELDRCKTKEKEGLKKAVDNPVEVWKGEKKEREEEKVAMTTGREAK